METRHPHLHRRAFAFADFLIVVAVIAILAGLLLPALAKSKAQAQRLSCNNNLKQVAISFRLWSGDNGDHYPPSVSTNKGGTKEYVSGTEVFRHYICMSNELSDPGLLVCPSDKRKVAGRSFTMLQNSNVSYFVGVDAEEMKPTMFLSGDRNLALNGLSVSFGLLSARTTNFLTWTDELHPNGGNLALADASVQSTSSSALQTLFYHTGTNLSRLAIP